MSESIFKVAAAQFAPVYLDIERSVEKAVRIMAEAARAGARLVVFPEVFLSGYPDWLWVVPNHQAPLLNELHTRLLNNAVVIPDRSTERLCEAARQNRICVVMGLHERNAEASHASLYNSLLFIDENGEIVGKHRKLVPTGAERMLWAQGDGGTLRTYTTSAGRLGGLICWENLMPLARQALYDHGIQILAAPTWDKSENWIASMRHVAREGGLFVISCCSAIRMEDIPEDCGFKSHYPGEREWVNVGNSCVINPKGEVIAGPLQAEEGLVIAEIDLEAILMAKRMFDVAGHYARPDVFEFGVRIPGRVSPAAD